MVTPKQEKHHLCAFFVRVIKAISAGLMSFFSFLPYFIFELGMVLFTFIWWKRRLRNPPI